ncbi:MAG TPA: cyclase family protein [Pyrinomonadaceae bacterium]|nr:cyclase family protein [Pyrinomonadaceae bacterium]
MNSTHKLIDVSHTVEHGMITYKGLPGPVITDHLTREASKQIYAAGTEFQIGNIEMVANTGTYLDSPFHRYADGPDLAALDFSSLANLDGILIRSTELLARAISIEALRGLELHSKAVLFHTGWDVHWRTETYSNGSHPYLTADAAEYLAQSGVALVGIDSYNIDDTNALDRPAHSTLLRNAIPIVEHLCGLSELPDRGQVFCCAGEG